MKTFRICVIACLVLGSLALDQTSAPALEILCRRELCGTFCAHGQVTDDRGCPTCECLQNPCDEASQCMPGQECTVKHVCESYPCTHEHAIALCQDSMPQVPCPMPMCMTDCGEAGYRNNERGCMTCECNDGSEPTRDPCEGYECPQNHTCIAIPASVPQEMRPRLMSYVQGMCLHMSDRDAFLNRFGDEEEPEPEEQPIRGPVDGVAPTPVPAPSAMPGLCHLQMRDWQEMVEQMLEHGNMPAPARDRLGAIQLNCKEDGSFHPKQCNLHRRQCHCVNDHGMPISGSEMPMHDGRPECAEHRTVVTEIVMVFDHDIEGDLDEHIEPIKQKIHEQLCIWLGVDQEIVIVREVSPHDRGQAITVVIELRDDGDTNLPHLAASLTWRIARDNLVIQYGDFTLSPDVRSFRTNHQTVQENSYDDKSHEDDDDSDEEEYGCARIWREHRGLAVVAGLGGGVILCVIIGLMCCCCKSRFRAKAQFSHKKLDAYKGNIAYGNEIMSSHPDMKTEKASRVDLYEVSIPEKY